MSSIRNLWTRHAVVTRDPPNMDLWADCLENVGTSTSHNPMGLHGLLQGIALLPRLYFQQKVGTKTHNAGGRIDNDCSFIGLPDRGMAYLRGHLHKVYSTSWAIGIQHWRDDYKSNKLWFRNLGVLYLKASRNLPDKNEKPQDNRFARQVSIDNGIEQSVQWLAMGWMTRGRSSSPGGVKNFHFSMSSRPSPSVCPGGRYLLCLRGLFCFV
jgi:hypothetical protein